MELTNEQRELLSAYLDGEVNASERALAQALLERAEAASYFDGLKRVRSLTQQHAQARAPQNFAALVRQSLEGDFDGISRPTSNQGDYDSISRPTSNQLQLNAVPQASWRMPLLAMAAAVVMAVGIFAVNSLLLPDTAAPALSTAGRDFHKDPEAAPAVEDALENLPGPELRDQPNADPNSDAPSTARPAPNPPSKKPESSNSTDKYERKTAPERPQDAADEQNEELKKGYAEGEGKESSDAKTKDDDRNAGPENSEKWGEGRSGGVGGGAGGGTRGGQGDGSPAEGSETVRRARAKSEGSEAGKKQDGTRADGGASPGQQPAPKALEVAHEVAIDFAGSGDSPTVATDVLQVASNFGAAKASTGEGGSSVEVEVDEDQVQELLAAINKLADSPAKETAREAQPAKGGEAPRARDYLPSHLRGAAEKDATARKEEAVEESKPDAPAQPPAPPAAKKKVRIIVRMK